MLVKEKYILITPEENRKNDVNCRRQLTNIIDEYKEDVVFKGKTICDYEIWDLKKALNIRLNLSIFSTLQKEEQEKIKDIKDFLIDNNLKYCFELKIKEVINGKNKI